MYRAILLVYLITNKKTAVSLRNPQEYRLHKDTVVIYNFMI